MSGYSHAWWRGYRAGLSWFSWLYVEPFWRGKKYRSAWKNGFNRSWRGGRV